MPKIRRIKGIKEDKRKQQALIDTPGRPFPTGSVSDKLATNSYRIRQQKSNFSDTVSDRLATTRNFDFFDFRAKFIKRPMTVNGTFDVTAERMPHQQML